MKLNHTFIFIAWMFIFFIGNSAQAQVFAIDDVPVTDEELPVYINVQDNDLNLGAGILYTVIVTLPEHGSVEIINQDSILYTPELNYNGIDFFTYEVYNEDEIPSTDNADVIVTILPVADYPVANNDTITTNTNQNIFIPVQHNDNNFDAEALVTSIIINPLHGTVSVISNDSILYTPETAYSGNDTLQYSICKSGSDIYCDTASVFIIINPINLFYPNAANDNISMILGAITQIDVLANDTDGDGDNLHISELLGLDSIKGIAEIDGFTQTVRYTATEKGFDTFKYVACDGNSPEYCDTATVAVHVDDIHVPDSFSPNNDGINDELLISGIEAYPQFNLKIFNRWGDLIFENSDPDISWDGTSNQQFIAPTGQMPEGTYFYILNLANSAVDLLKGYIILRR